MTINEKKFTTVLVWASVLVIFGSLTALGQESPGQKLFEGKCYSCHNIGSGDKKVPDLKGLSQRRTREWIDSFVLTPTSMKNAGDPVAAELFKKFSPEIMPDQTLTMTEIDQIIALIGDLTAKNQVYVPAGAKLDRAIVPSDVPAGMDIFTGRSALSGGGTACISCHTVNHVGRLGGGTLGPDLTAANVKYRDPELISILQNPNFPTMSSVFAKRPLNDEEIVKVFAYLQSAKFSNPTAVPTVTARIEPMFIGIGFIALSVTLVGFNFIWRNRNRGVREEIVRRAKK